MKNKYLIILITYLTLIGCSSEEISSEEMYDDTQINDTTKVYLRELNIVNNTDINKNSDDYGIIGYNIPEKFKVNEYSNIKLRITKSMDIESIIIGDRRIPLISEDSKDKIILETIKIDDRMTANLYTDPNLFEVSMVNEKSEQSLYEEGYTEWVWRVRPLKPGNHHIKMLITISGRDIVVYEKNIPVYSNWSFSFLVWFSTWWETITATIITPILIPFFIWLYKKKSIR
jgi:hypothetical protein